MTRYFSLPYDSGYKDLRMGAGPSRIVRELGVDAEEIHPASEWRAEIKTTFELYRALAERVRATNDFPVVFSGNCGGAIGAAAGIGTDDLAVLWFDAHGDYNTPDTTDSGYLDGMALGILTGRCWKSLASTIPHFAPVPPSRVVHIGSRDYSPGEREAMEADGMIIGPRFDAVHAKRILVHVDLDVIDPQYGHANQYAAGGGLSPDAVLQAIDLAQERFTIAALVLASYDPAFDDDGRIAAIAARIARAVAH